MNPTWLLVRKHGSSTHVAKAAAVRRALAGGVPTPRQRSKPPRQRWRQWLRHTTAAKDTATPRAGLVLPKGTQQRAHDKSIRALSRFTSPSGGPLRLRSTRSYRHALSAAVFAARERPGAFRRRGTPVIR